LIDKNYIKLYRDEMALSKLCANQDSVDVTGTAGHSVLKYSYKGKELGGGNAHWWVRCLA
jgi:hypothetical protein